MTAPGSRVSDSISIPRPQRWQTPFGQEMTAADVERVLALPPFAGMDRTRFAPPVTLDGIVQFDTRIVCFQDGDIVVRAGDYGNSAFLILSGTLRVVLPPGLPAELLGRASESSKGWLGALSQLWQNPKMPEVRDASRYTAQAALGRRDAADRPRVFLQDVAAIVGAHETATIATGDLFGEIAALGRTQRVATVFAQGDSECLEIRWQGLRDIRRRDDAFRRHVEKLYRERSLITHLHETSLFKDLPDAVIEQIADETLFETYGDFDWYGTYKRFSAEPPEERLAREPVIAAEGDYPDGVLLVRSGFGRVSRRVNHGHRTLRYLGRGGVFGLEEILQGWQTGEVVPLGSTLRAVGYTDVLRVPTRIIEQLVLPRLAGSALRALRGPPTVAAGATAAPAPEAQPRRGTGAPPLDPAFLEMLVDNRFINGTATMLVNLDRCVRCDACVDACAVNHGNNPRFNRHGPRYGAVMVANACMHCADPVCMIGCPTGAIHRSADGGQVVISDDTCIGCATCANSCPYDNIRMADIRDDSGRFIVDQATQAPIRKATKCDLCHDLPGGPACQRACPHDALIRIDLRDLDRLSQWLNR